MVTLTAISGRPLRVDPKSVRQVLGNSHAQVYLDSGIDFEVRETRDEALERITAPKCKRR